MGLNQVLTSLLRLPCGVEVVGDGSGCRQRGSACREKVYPPFTADLQTSTQRRNDA